MAKKLTVTLPDGTIAIRSTDNPYTHAVAYHIHRDDGAVYWKVPHWSRTEAGAHRLMSGNGIVIPVNSPEESAKLLAAKTPKAEYPPYQWTTELIEADEHYANRSLEWLSELLEYEVKRNRKDGALFIAALKQVIVRRQTVAFETGLVYDRPQPATPNTYPDGFESRLVHTEDGTPYLTLVRKPALTGEIIPDKPDTWIEQIARGLFALVTDDVVIGKSTLPTFGDIEDIAFKHVNFNDTGTLYDQPQSFTFDFKRGDVVEFQFAFPCIPAHKGWLKGVFYNIYPGDKRLACIRREGIYEAARLADIRKPLPVAVDIFDGMGDFVVKASDSAKAA